MNIQEYDNELNLITGILVEAAEIDGKIDEREVDSIRNSLKSIFKENQEEIDPILRKCLEKAGEPNSIHRLTSTINKEFEYEKKIQLLEILWEVILADGKVHDFESNLIRRLAGLLYISEIHCGDAKKRIY